MNARTRFSATHLLLLLACICIAALFVTGCGGDGNKSASSAEPTSETSEALESLTDDESFAYYAEKTGLSVENMRALYEADDQLLPGALDECDTDFFPYDANDGSEEDDFKYYIHCVKDLPTREECTSGELDACQIIASALSCREEEGLCDMSDPIGSYQWVQDEKLE